MHVFLITRNQYFGILMVHLTNIGIIDEVTSIRSTLLFGNQLIRYDFGKIEYAFGQID